MAAMASYIQGYQKAGAKPKSAKAIRDAERAKMAEDTQKEEDARAHAKVPPLTDEETNLLLEAFVLFDSERQSALDPRELRSCLRALGFSYTEQQVLKMYEVIGKEPKQEINFDGFCNMMRGKMPDKRCRAQIDRMFKLFDVEAKGRISFKDMKHVCQELGDDATDAEIQEMLEEADHDGDGKLGPDEFYRVMRKKLDDPNGWESDDDDDDADKSKK